MSRLCLCLAGVLLAAGLAVLSTAPAHADPEEGGLRLRGGPSHNEGRLEIYHDNEWGTVCDDFFGRRDAKVACKQMGYTGAEAYLTDVAVAPGRRFWLDDVNCIGSEEKLIECFYNSNVRNSSSRTDPQWGIANCIPSEQVGVRCTASTTDKSVELNESHLTVQEQGGGSTYTVRLGTQPTGNVTVAISGQSSTVTVDSTPLTFTTGNWSTPQTVTLTANNDTNRTDDSFTVTHTASGGGYGSVTASLSVTVEDDDGPVQAHIDSGGIVSLTEGGRRTYRIWLDSAPTEQVTVAVTAPSKVSVTPTSLTFTTGNWSTAQTATLEASHDNDTSDETQYVTHRATKGGYTTTLSRVQVEITDDDDGEDQIGSRPSGALWWAALTARRETGGATGHINYTSPHADLGKLSNSSFTYNGVARAIKGVFADASGHFQIWVDSGNGSALPNSVVLHVGNRSIELGSATRQTFRTMYNDGRAPTMRDHTYWWQSGSHGVSLSDRQVVAVWLEAPAGSELPGTPRSVEAQARDGGASLEWVPPPEVPSKPVTSYEYQQEGTQEWTSTGGTATTKEVTGLANGESYTFRVRAVNAAGKGAASAPMPAVTPAAPGLTGSFESVPEAHDGSSAFALRLAFSEDVAGRFRNMRNDIFEVTGGALTDLRRVDRRRDLWTVTVTPSSDDAVTVTVAVPANRACDVSGAVCTADGEQLTSRAEVTVPGPQPTVSVSAGPGPVTEGTAAAFTLTRTGAAASALTVTVSVSEEGAVLSGTPASAVTFGAGSDEATLSVATDDDSVAEADGRVTASVVAGSGYGVEANASAAAADVYDNDEAATTPTTAVERLWTSTLTVESIGGVLLGTVGGGNALSPDGWSEDGEPFEVEQLYYFPQYSELAFTLSVAPSETGQLTLHLDDLQVQLRGSPGVRYFYWVVDHPGWQAGQAVAVKLTRTDPDAAPEAGPGLSVADARVREAEGAALPFRVTLDAAQDSTVSVRYATADGTAVAGADYETAFGVVRFAPGETAKTLSVGVLNDAHDEGSETLTLALSRPFGAELVDGTATGTIANTGPMPQAWITRFGRTVGLQALEAIGDRVGGSGATGGTQVVVGGVELVGSGEFAGAMLDGEAGWPTRPDDLEGSGFANERRGMTGRELLLGSSFRFGAGGEAGGPSWAAWGRFATSGFQGEEADLSLSGDVTTGFLGADLSLERGLAGLAVGVSEGEGSFDNGAGDGGGTVQSSLTSVFPYARLAIGDGLDIWGLVGVGSGDLTLAVGEEVTRTDLSMRMGALGLRGEIVTAEEEGDFGLAWKSDALWVRTESAASRSSTGGKLEAASGDVSRVRVTVEGSRAFAAGPGSAVTPTLEIGLRHDGGDAETGAGVEAGFGLEYSNPAQGLTMEGRVRGLLAHTDGAYEEWGASGSLRLDPGISGRGVSLTVAPVWGAASGGVEQLWSTGTAAGLAADDAFDAQARLQAELGYGLRPPVGQGVLTPYAGFTAAGDGVGRTYRLGARWRSGPLFQMALEGSHGEADGDAQPVTTATLRASYRW